MNNKFRILIASHNNERWIKYNLSSVMNQTYKNYEVFYIDDSSSDKTYHLAKKIIGNDPRFALIRNEKNMGGTYNHLYYATHNLYDDNTIICLLDGDDWLYDITVLEKLNEFYNKHNSWMTYGGMVVQQDNQIVEANPQNSPYDETTHRKKSYRDDVWRASHFRTYRAFLWKSVNKSDMFEIGTSKYYEHAGDLALQFPCLEICPAEKIGVVPFNTYVYNATSFNTIRTSNRQMDDKHFSIESEIRSKKKYREGIGNGKYPQVNVYGYPFPTDYFPKDFTYIQNKTTGEFDVTIITDFEIPNYINKSIHFECGKIVADLHEGRNYSNMNEIYEMVYNNYTMFDLILTHDPKILSLPNSKLRLCMWRYHLTNTIDNLLGGIKVQDDSVCMVHTKTKNISCISSNKNFLPGHQKRLQFINHIRNNSTRSMFDMFGLGFKEIGGKIEGLKDYRFSISIENDCLVNGASEKISDCFLTGTIPIYYGCPNIGDYFDMDGIFYFDTENELEEIILRLNEEGEIIYNRKIDAVKNNYNLVLEYSLNPDKHFQKYLKNLIFK